MKEKENMKGLVIEKINDVNNGKYFSEYTPIDSKVVDSTPVLNFGCIPDSSVIFG